MFLQGRGQSRPRLGYNNSSWKEDNHVARVVAIITKRSNHIPMLMKMDMKKVTKIAAAEIFSHPEDLRRESTLQVIIPT